MKTRCYNDKEPCWKNYGGRGIKVCAEWQEFVPFMKWALANGYRPGLEIDRRDNDGDYSPDNCRFVTTVVNMRNKRNNHPITIGGETRILAEWAEISGLHHTLVLYRLRDGWDEEDLLVPVGTYHNYANPRVKKVLEEALV
ncbi:MAG: hypothetical protein QME44_04465 [Thermodesulfobacteriota bacterium]|nr:hypothetical protein [Thermodesulfobacteriota bacterium]